MHRNKHTDEGTWIFYRILSCLIVLAGVAERAASLSPSARSAILWLLRPNEARVRKWLLRDTSACAAPYHISEGDTPADALALADRYMELASILNGMLAYEALIAAFSFEHCLPVSSYLATADALMTANCQARVLARFAGPIPDT